MFNLEAVSAKRLYRIIADRITDKIVRGEFPIGTRLPAERELADILQVSRSSVREALIALELSGYIEVRMGTGIFVIANHDKTPAASPKEEVNAPATLRYAEDVGPFDLLQTRLLLEPECAAHAALSGSDEQLDAIAKAHQAMSFKDTPSDGDRAFHAAIATACGNAALEAVVLHAWDLSAASPMYRRLDAHFVDSKVWKLAYEEHEAILSAILDRDPIRARHAMYVHLLGIMARMRESDLAESRLDAKDSSSLAPRQRRANEPGASRRPQ